MELLSVCFSADYFGYLLRLVPVGFLLGGFLVFVCWALGMCVSAFIRIVRS